jgi:hypothetical protein
MKHSGFLLRATSKVQNVVTIASCVQSLEANLHKHQATKAKSIAQKEMESTTFGAKPRRKHKCKV